MMAGLYEGIDGRLYATDGSGCITPDDRPEAAKHSRTPIMSNAKPEVEAVARAIAESDTRVDSGIRNLYDVPSYRETVTKHAQAAITAYHAHLADAGFAIVPVEPTEAMEVAGGDALGNARWAVNSYEADAHECYRAMIAAAKEGDV